MVDSKIKNELPRFWLLVGLAIIFSTAIVAVATLTREDVAPKVTITPEAIVLNEKGLRVYYMPSYEGQRAREEYAAFVLSYDDLNACVSQGKTKCAEQLTAQLRDFKLITVEETVDAELAKQTPPAEASDKPLPFTEEEIWQIVREA